MKIKTNQPNQHHHGSQQNQHINALYFRPTQAQADPVLVQILTQIQQLMQRPSSTDKCVMLAQHPFHSSMPSAGKNHWTSFDKFVVFQTRQGSITTFDEFKSKFTLTLTDIAWN